MTSSIPDSFSMKDLEALASNAPREVEQEVDNSDELTQEQLTEIAQRHTLAALDECNQPIIHKAMLFQILSNMIDWHTRMGESMFEDKETEAGIAWLRDAGKFQSCLSILKEINVGENDFITPND